MFQLDNIYLFLIILPIVSFLYSSVGHGGASGYLALMALFSFAPETMKPTALLLNLFVAGISFYYYFKEGFFNKKLFISFAISSIPLAFLGGTIEIDATIYKKVLAVLLVFAILKMLNVFGKETDTIKQVKLWQGLIVGGIIGFFSGLIGIGGGIFLAPLLHLTNWDTPKKIAATASFFILANSIAGILGLYSSPNLQVDWIFTSILMVTVFVGGQIGSRMSNTILTPILLKKATAILIGSVSIRILCKHLLPFFTS